MTSERVKSNKSQRYTLQDTEHAGTRCFYTQQPDVIRYNPLCLLVLISSVGHRNVVALSQLTDPDQGTPDCLQARSTVCIMHRNNANVMAITKPPLLPSCQAHSLFTYHQSASR
jgi:hypothetical protein